jgi:hypothetical protein
MRLPPSLMMLLLLLLLAQMVSLISLGLVSCYLSRFSVSDETTDVLYPTVVDQSTSVVEPTYGRKADTEILIMDTVVSVPRYAAACNSCVVRQR